MGSAESSEKITSINGERKEENSKARTYESLRRIHRDSCDVDNFYAYRVEEHDNLHQNPASSLSPASASSSSPVSTKSSKKINILVDPPDMNLICLGTTSMAPTTTRNVSCVALRIGSCTWLFDCGEGSQHQFLHSNGKLIKPSSITRIYISHLHGDHIYGLPGMLCKLSIERPPTEPLVIIGPKGLRAFIRASLNLSFTELDYYYIVHEIHSNAYEGSNDASVKEANNDSHPLRLHRNELPGGLDIIPNNTKDRVWLNLPYCKDHPCEKDCVSDAFTVHAAELSHRVFTVGYVIMERNYPGNVDAEKARQKLMTPENQAFLSSKGIKKPMAVLSQLKAGNVVELSDGMLKIEDVTGPQRRGRKVVILGDTSDSRYIAGLAAGADVLVHESTNALLPAELDKADGSRTLEDVVYKSVSRGHSVANMAGAFAGACGIGHLILTHFSPRYRAPVMDQNSLKYDTDENKLAIKTMDHIQNEAFKEMKVGRATFDEKLNSFSPVVSNSPLPLNCTAGHDYLMIDIKRNPDARVLTPEEEKIMAKFALQRAAAAADHWNALGATSKLKEIESNSKE